MSSQSWLDYNYLFNAAAEPVLFIHPRKEGEGGLSENREAEWSSIKRSRGCPLGSVQLPVRLTGMLSLLSRHTPTRDQLSGLSVIT